MPGKKIQIVDGHTHFDSIDVSAEQIEDLNYQGADQFAVLVVERFLPDYASFKQPQGLWMKWKLPDLAFLFGGIDWGGFIDPEKRVLETGLVEQAQRMKSLGFDGLKLLTGKPNVLKALGQEQGLELDGPELRPLLEWLEETGFPVLWHVSDPEEFWCEATLPLWARGQGWAYGPTHPAKAQIHRSLRNVLRRHPKLNLILPHFCFLAGRLDEAAEVLDGHPNVFFDLAPGVEWLHQLTANREAGREFFVHYADRIIYGTDMGMKKNATHRDRARMIQRFLETEDRFPVPHDIFMHPDERGDLQGLGLPESVLEPIYAANFHRAIGSSQPLPLDVPGVCTYLEELDAQASAAGQSVPEWKRIRECF